MEPNFKLNRPPISDEEINSKKDFGELVNKFKKQSIAKARSDASFFKNKKVTYSSIIAGVAVVCTVTYFSVFKKNPPKEVANDKIITQQNLNTNTNNTKLSKAFIAPPISKLNVPYTSYKVKNEQGATIKHSSNSKLIIPKKTFINKQGQDIVGDVEIQYRELHNQADIIASGIPMAYDSAGIASHLESAGMLDIKGFQNGEPVFINPKKQITIEFASQHTEDKYNMYELDTIAKNWVYTGRDNSLKGKEIQPRLKEQKPAKELTDKIDAPKAMAIQKQIDAIPPKIEIEKTVYSKKVNQLPKAIQPTAPTKAIAGKPQFELDVNYKEFPELEAFKNAVFEVGSENKNYNSKLSEVTWSSAQISEGPQKGKNYVLTLKLRERVEKLVVYPALTGADYIKALQVYETKFEDYKKLVIKREADEKKLKEEFEAKQAAYLAEMKKLSEEKLKENINFWKEQNDKLNNQFSAMGNLEKVTRIFQVSHFGIYNSDCPNSLPKGEKMHPTYVIHNDKTINPTSIYLICHSKNLVYNLPQGELPYNANESYSICILLKNKLYLCDKATFSAITNAKQSKITLTELSANVNDASDLKKAMGI